VKVSWGWDSVATKIWCLAVAVAVAVAFAFSDAVYNEAKTTFVSSL